ncbi:type IX secretion system sortase PorU [Adhaeribacter radiodurans]|uniref:Type IX secretion system sortase PorU n=1 Tax=Adhaeribacter radiodurans TaxID=2745197 RepID=A0A7L7LBP4_9BACT|nr:type IX secretion system sortase PorU [Adhaeribacter radiodurans]QMU30193.1 type IX secretion system sortase PorU [Adhaeribacter radiodurans]
MLKSITSFLLFLLSLTTFGQSHYADASVLSNGTWYTIGIPGSGLYKLDKAALQNMGIVTANLNPKNIRLFGNGGGMLPQLNATLRPDDLIENAIYVVGESDGKFDSEDYILFYGQGPHTWRLDANQQTFRHEFNTYSDTAYYFLQIGETTGLRINEQALLTGATATINSYVGRIFHEVDLKNKLLSGRNWVGEEFSSFTLTRDFNFPITDILPNSIVQVKAAVVGDSPTNSSFDLKLNNTAIGTLSIAGRGNFDYHPVGVLQVGTFEKKGITVSNANELKISLTYNIAGNAAALGYLDYLEILAERQLKLSGNQTDFRSLQNIYPGAVSTFKVADMPVGATIWDITRPTRPVVPALTFTSSTASFTVATDSLKEFIAFTGQDFPAPVFVGIMPNQNLHALNKDGKTDLVIITHPAFLPQAERLATHRQTNDGLQVNVVTTQQVYNEFSSGAQDISAIRDFMKMIYERSPKAPEKTLNLLLLGDASYDYKSANTNNPKNRTLNNTNYVPTYQSRESLDPLESYSSEDYFGFLDDTEGFWDESDFSNPDLMDIGVGRLPVHTILEAEIIVTKLIHYNDPKTFGNWRNRLVLAADDGDGTEHLRDAEFLADYMKLNQPVFNIHKVYLDMFKQENGASGQLSPDANKSIDQAVERGALIVNYTGHGGETTLAQEKIVTIPQITNWKNKDKLAFLITATCEFGRYDDPARSSGAEYALINENGGAIGLISTTRPVYAGGNRVLNKNFFEIAFTPLNGQMPRLGDVLRLTKNRSLSQVNNRNFALLGDPSMRLAYPNLQVSLDKVNGTDISAGIDTLKALTKITFAGSIKNNNQAIVDSFNGLVQVIVYEKETQINTLGDESANGVSNVRAVPVRENIIYDGTASVNAGLFSISFMVPKDIAYNLGNGKVSFYAYSGTTDAQGAYANIIVGGANPNSTSDNQPPNIGLFMDDETFKSGGLTGSTTTLLAHITDENGINTTGIGIGHEITAVLDGDKKQSINLNNYFTAETDNYQTGQVRYPLSNLSVGKHQISVKAWDTYNNSAESKIEFEVADSKQLALDKVFNYPNPMYNQTTFQFDHNRQGDNLNIEINIFSITGTLVKTLTGTSFASKPHFNAITWDGRKENKQALAKGLYIYVLTVRSNLDGSTASKTQKLILLN